MSRNARTLLGLAAGLAVLGADQASKYWMLEVLRLPELGQVALLPVFSLTFVQNRGITFGLFSAEGAAGGIVLAAVALAVVVALGVWLRRAERRLVAVSLGAVAGGAIGNVIDRLRFGFVVDFLHVHTPAMGWSWYVFNVADAAIVCGVAALVLDGMRRPEHSRLAATPGDK
jgi:lipoprotein signal peptidase